MEAVVALNHPIVTRGFIPAIRGVRRIGIEVPTIVDGRFVPNVLRRGAAGAKHQKSVLPKFVHDPMRHRIGQIPKVGAGFGGFRIADDIQTAIGSQWIEMIIVPA